MDFKVIITRRATQDLKRVVEFIAADNPTAAEKLGLRVLARFDGLAKFPLMGRVVPELKRHEWRELIYGSYRLIYRVDERNKIVYAARIWHAARGTPEIDE